MLQISSSWDDGGISDTRIADLMVQYNIPSVFYWPVNWQKVNQKQNREALGNSQADDIAKHFEIGSHGVNHELLTKVPEETALYEISTSKSALESRFGKTVTKFCYPRGYYNDDIKAMVKGAGYEMARTVEVGCTDLADHDPFETPTTVHVGYDRKEYDGKPWLDYARDMLYHAEALAIERDVHYQFFGHSWELTKYNGWEDLHILLEAINGLRR